MRKNRPHGLFFVAVLLLLQSAHLSNTVVFSVLSVADIVKTIRGMKIILLAVGKTDAEYLQKGIADYSARLSHYLPFCLTTLPDVRNSRGMSEDTQRQQEGRLILSQVETSDTLVLLDEGGAQFTSRQFAQFFVKMSSTGTRRVVFVIGGPYGFSSDVYARANHKVSLSPMTFSHQMVRLIFVEQLYRAQTILRGEPYHHD